MDLFHGIGFKRGFLILFCLYFCFPTGVNSIPDYYKEQIDRSKDDVTRILNYIHRGEGRHKSYERLAEFGDRFGSRLSGSESLERAIDYTVEHMRNMSLDNVAKEPVQVPRWTRGREYGILSVPDYGWTRNIEIMALGRSVGTNGGTLTAEGIVVNSREHLEGMDNSTVAGKIVIFNAPRPWTGYNTEFRVNGALYAERKGAVAALIRSVTANSIYSAHTGGTSALGTIPTAAITLEDAELMQRIHERHLPFFVTIYMEAQNFNDTTSYNAIGDIRGSDNPDQLVLIGGHIDTWDVTDGSMDDGGGVIMAWEAVRVLRELELTPKRSIRLIMWTAEELGLIGAAAYYRAHNATDLNVTSVAMQADQGLYYPAGIKFTGSDTAREIMEYIMETMLGENNTTQVCPGSGSSSDTGVWVSNGVPGVELCVTNQNYFDFHHSRGDSMLVIDEDELDRATAVWAVVAYVIANMDDMLPRVGDPTTPPGTGSTTPNVDATGSTTPNVDATGSTTPNVDATGSTTPNVDATGSTTPNVDATGSTTPNVDATGSTTPDVDATGSTTPNIDTGSTISNAELGSTTPDVSQGVITRPVLNHVMLMAAFTSLFILRFRSTMLAHECR